MVACQLYDLNISFSACCSAIFILSEVDMHAARARSTFMSPWCINGCRQEVGTAGCGDRCASKFGPKAVCCRNIMTSSLSSGLYSLIATTHRGDACCFIPYEPGCQPSAVLCLDLDELLDGTITATTGPRSQYSIW